RNACRRPDENHLPGEKRPFFPEETPEEINSHDHYYPGEGGQSALRPNFFQVTHTTELKKQLCAIRCNLHAMKALETPRNAPLQNGILLCVVISISALRGRGCAFIPNNSSPHFLKRMSREIFSVAKTGQNLTRRTGQTNRSLPPPAKENSLQPGNLQSRIQNPR